MKKLIVRMLLIMRVAAAWAGPFDGTWVGDVASSTVEGKPDTYLLQDGVYTCDACYPELKIPADGKTHKVTDIVYYDEASATVVSPQVVKVQTTQWRERNLESAR